MPVDSKTLIGFDCETWALEPGVKAPRLVCMTLWGLGPVPDYVAAIVDDVEFSSEEGGGWGVLLGRKAAVEVFPSMLADQKTTFVAHNSPFDICVLVRAVQEDTGVDLLDTDTTPNVWDNLDRIKDTLVREKLLAIATDNLNYDSRTGRKTKFSLAYLVSVYFKVDISSKKSVKDCACEVDPVHLGPCLECRSWRKVYHQLDGVPVKYWPSDAKEYAVSDAKWAVLCCLEQSAQLSIQGYPVVYASGDYVDEIPQNRAHLALHLMSVAGVRTNKKRVLAWGKQLRESIEGGTEAAREAGFLRDNGTKDMKKLYALVEAAYDGNPPRTPTGKPQAGEEVLKNSGHPLLMKYAGSLKQRKNLTTDYPKLLRGVDVPMTYEPNILVATGRTSIRNPSLQQPPRVGEFRNCFVPRPGNVFVMVDYDTIELRALSQFCLWQFKQSAMAEAILGGLDIHLALGAELGDMSYGDAKEAKEDPNHPLHSKVKGLRHLAKAANFGFPGGLGPATFVKNCAENGITMTESEARTLRGAWFKRWPEMRLFLNYVGRLAEGGDFVLRQPVSGRVRGGCKYCSGANTHFQGLVADGAKNAIYKLARECYGNKKSALYGVRPWVFIHDEVISEGPLTGLDKWATEKARIMVEGMQPYIPDIPVTASPIAMECWSKSAEEVRDDQGKLIPWRESP